MSDLLLYILRYLPCLKIYVSGLIFHSFAVLKPKPAFSQIALVWHKKKELEEDGGVHWCSGKGDWFSDKTAASPHRRVALKNKTCGFSLSRN